MLFIELFMRKFDAAKKNEDEIEIAVGEALANAVISTVITRIPQSGFMSVCRCSMDGEVLITVRDENEGFDCSSVPDPTLPQQLFLSHRRGLHLMRALMDEVSFEENGTVVQMRKRLRSVIR
jgi:serine/threonine-protein kinase RsbW